MSTTEEANPRSLRGAATPGELLSDSGNGVGAGGNRETALAILFVLGCIAYLAFLMEFGRPFATDESFYKGPGLNWAKGGAWAAPEQHGFGGYRPGLDEVFLAYPPGYSFGFGVIVKVLGFGWRQCVFYDGFIHICLTVRINTR